jgi:DNA-binding response OmpR family regulator
MANKKILLIEDDLNTGNLYSDILKTEGYDVVTAPDGQEGLLKAENDTFDLIILDAMIPKMDGLEVLAAIKKKDSACKVAIFSNLSFPDVISEAKKLGADAFIHKSDTDPGKLLEKVKDLVGED